MGPVDWSIETLPKEERKKPEGKREEGGERRRRQEKVRFKGRLIIHKIEQK